MSLIHGSMWYIKLVLYTISSGGEVFLLGVMTASQGNVLFNDALYTFYLWLYGIRHMVKNHSDSDRGNLLLPHRLRFQISSKGSFICIIPLTG